MNTRLIPLTVALALSATAALAQDDATMKAVRMHEHGDASVLRYEDAPVPNPGEGEVLVRVHASGVNPVDWKIRDGNLGNLSSAMPYTLGYDIAGVVESLGDGVEGFAIGDDVFAYMPIRGGGGYAEFAVVATSALAKMPESIDYVHSAGVPLAALTAWQALIDIAQLQAGQTILIHAGAGGVGHFAVQIAKSLGATVITTASPRNHEFLRELGADQVIDYRTQNFWEVAGEVDVVLDAIGGETQERSYDVLKEGGFLVSIVQPPAPEKLKEHGVRGQIFLVQPNAEDLTQIAKLIDAGKIVPHVSLTVPLEDVAKAHAQSEGGHTRGKIVLKVR